MDAHQCRQVSGTALLTSPRYMHVSTGNIISKKQPFYSCPVSVILEAILFIWHINMRTGKHQVFSRCSKSGK